MNPLDPFPSKKPIPWFAIAVGLVVLGGIFLVIFATQRGRGGSAASTQGPAEFYTQAAQTIAALQASAVTVTPVTPATDTPAAPTMTPFPDLSFSSPTVSATPSTVLATLPSGSYCDNSIYVSDVTIPDNTVITAGATFTKTWALQNTGSCTWTTGYTINFLSGTQMGGKATNLTASVAPSANVQVSVSLTAPTAVGTYTGYWRMANAQGSMFGQAVTVVIVVSSSATGTPTVTPTATSTGGASVASATPTRTSSPAHGTATPTNTPKPASSPTDTYTPIPPTATDTTAPTATPSDTAIPTPTATPSSG